VITIQNSEAIVRRDINDSGWYVLNIKKHIMSIKITFTEEEILSTSNYYEMGKKVHDRFWQAKRDLEGPQIDDEHVGLTINEDGLVTAIHRPDDYDTCIVCGKITPYLKSTNINLRYGYIEGAGQACPHPDNCD